MGSKVVLRVLSMLKAFYVYNGKCFRGNAFVVMFGLHLVWYQERNGGERDLSSSRMGKLSYQARKFQLYLLFILSHAKTAIKKICYAPLCL